MILNAILDAYPNFIGLQICFEYKLVHGFKKVFQLTEFLRLSILYNNKDKIYLKIRKEFTTVVRIIIQTLI